MSVVGARFARQCRDALDELMLLAPWIVLLSSPNSSATFRSRRDPDTARTGSTEANCCRRSTTARSSAAPEETAWLDELRR